MSELYIGIMSGTSADGIDVALVDFEHPRPKLIASYYHKYTPELRNEIFTLCHPGVDEINRLADLDINLGSLFAMVVKRFLQELNIEPRLIRAIGLHGQTIRHRPAYHSLQVGDPNIVAAETGITTINDFRRRDIAEGGQGAPLVPAFHQTIFGESHHNRAIVNIGGIANVTLLPLNKDIFGFDTGPGNCLLDAWIEKEFQLTYDQDGQWAAQGKVNAELLNKLLSDDFFQQKFPKSTGREYFNLHWLQGYLMESIRPVDVQATLLELTARSIMDAISNNLKNGEIIICGGGAHNSVLMKRLASLATNFSVTSTEKFGISPDWIEAMAFAWLAKQTLEKKTGNLPSVTGAKMAAILGGVYF